MQFKSTSLEGVFVVEPRVFGDDRGFFMETWNERVFQELGQDIKFVQDNHSKSNQGILRGLHYQTAHTQAKLVRVTAGEVFDVVVDLRESSPTFGKHEGIFLSAENKNMLWVPEGFAHGFYVTTESAEFVYKCTDFYDPNSEVSMRWDDPALGINWPLIDGAQPQLSDKDRNGLSFADAPKFA